MARLSPNAWLRCQFGFRKGRGTLHAVRILDSRMYRALMLHEHLEICFIDSFKAFDTCPISCIAELLRMYGYPEDIAAAIEDTHHQTTVLKFTDGTYTPPFDTTIGTTQGSKSAPTIFNLFLDLVLRNMPPEILDKVEFIAFADDIAIIGHSTKDIKEATIAYASLIGKLGMKLNAKKTKAMQLSFPEGSTSGQDSRAGHISRIRKLGCSTFTLHDAIMLTSSFDEQNDAYTVNLPDDGDVDIACNCCPYVARGSLKTSSTTLMKAHVKRRHPHANIHYLCHDGALPQQPCLHGTNEIDEKHLLRRPQRTTARDRKTIEVVEGSEAFRLVESEENSAVCWVNEFKYLGVLLNCHCDYTAIAESQCAKASRALGILRRGAKDLQLESKLALYDMCIVPILLYGCEALEATAVNIIKKAHYNHLKWVTGIYSEVVNGIHLRPRYATLLQQANCNDIRHLIRFRTIQLWASFERQKEIQSMIAPPSAPTTRSNKQPTRWLDRVQEALRSLDIDDSLATQPTELKKVLKCHRTELKGQVLSADPIESESDVPE